MTKLVLPEGKVFRKDIYFQETGYSPHRGQRIVHYNGTRHRVLVNGRRWGKTLCGAKEAECMAFIKNGFGQPQIGWIIGPEYTDCEKEFRVIYDSLRALGVDKLSPRFTNNVDSGNMHIKTSWGFELQARSARHPESLVGEGLDFVLIVEGGRHKRKMWGDYVRPALSDKRGWSFTSGVPEGATETSLLYSLWQRGQDQAKKSWWSMQMPSWTNDVVFPGGREDPEIVEARDDLTNDEFDRQYGAQFVDNIGRVMKEWDDDDHIADLEYNRKWPLYAAIDFGYTNDWVWLWIQEDEFHNIYVIGEHRYRLRDTEDIARLEFKNHPLIGKLRAIYPDPAAPDDAAILRRTLNVPTMGNTGGELKTRLSLIRSALKLRPAHLPDGHPEKKPQLLIDRSCTDLIFEMREGYRWPERRSEDRNDSELPMDTNNHGPEALGRFFKGHMEPKTSARRARQTQIKMGRRRR